MEKFGKIRLLGIFVVTLGSIAGLFANEGLPAELHLSGSVQMPESQKQVAEASKQSKTSEKDAVQESLTPMKKPKEVTYAMLTRDEQKVYDSLSPKYKKIFLCVLTRQEREQVTVFARRGQSPYDSINRILSRDRAKSDHTPPEDSLSPAESATRRAQRGSRIYY